MKLTAGSSFDSAEGYIYFIAANTSRQQDGARIHPYNLISVNEINGLGDMDTVLSWCDMGCKVYMDSGVFNLSMEHARKHNIPMDEALQIPPEEIEGFGALMARYIEINKEWGDRFWGYVEIDQGGREQKIKTRKKLERLGLAPIPVYHPLNDGWDYFDHLAQHYDRICFGNVVQAEDEMRRRLMATAWERRRKYPNLWIHLLGMTPNTTLSAYPMNSSDSSTWLSGVRWGVQHEFVDQKDIGDLPHGFRYAKGEEGSDNKAAALSAYVCNFQQRNMRNRLGAIL